MSGTRLAGPENQMVDVVERGELPYLADNQSAIMRLSNPIFSDCAQYGY